MTATLLNNTCESGPNTGTCAYLGTSGLRPENWDRNTELLARAESRIFHGRATAEETQAYWELANYRKPEEDLFDSLFARSCYCHPACR